LAYTIIAETRNQRLLGDRFTADTAHEAFGRVQDIRRRGVQVRITGSDGDLVSENELEAKAAGSRSARGQPTPTTFNFTDYLSKMSPDWKSKVGFDTELKEDLWLP
jgi:hypothetical protein